MFFSIQHVICFLIMKFEKFSKVKSNLISEMSTSIPPRTKFQLHQSGGLGATVTLNLDLSFSIHTDYDIIITQY